MTSRRPNSMANNSDNLIELLRDVRSYANFLKDIGLEYGGWGPAAACPAPAAPAQDLSTPAPTTTPRGASAPRPATSVAATQVAAPMTTPAPVATPPLAPAENAPAAALEQIAAAVAACTACPLHQGRQNTVPGEGSPRAELMFIGEGPGADEDRLGRPFVGAAGRKLDEMIAYLGLRREDVFIGNIVKCRPPKNRVPETSEALACRHFIFRQVEIIQPKVICLLGATALRFLLDKPNVAITRMRGIWHDYRGIAVMPTFHPAFLLRQYTIENRRAMVADMDAIREKMKSLGCRVGDKPQSGSRKSR